jgi:hypothetical protein
MAMMLCAYTDKKNWGIFFSRKYDRDQGITQGFLLHEEMDKCSYYMTLQHNTF